MLFHPCTHIHTPNETLVFLVILGITCTDQLAYRVQRKVTHRLYIPVGILDNGGRGSILLLSALVLYTAAEYGAMVHGHVFEFGGSCNSPL